MGTKPATIALHPVLQAYAERHGLEPRQAREDGGLTLVVDSLYRVLLVPVVNNHIALASTLLDLATLPEHRRGDCLRALATRAGGLMRDHASTLALDEAGGSLMLQQVVVISSHGDWLEDQIAEFVNVLAFWRLVIDREVAHWKA